MHLRFNLRFEIWDFTIRQSSYSIFLYANTYVLMLPVFIAFNALVFVRERKRGIFGFYNITILMQFALGRSSQHCPNEIEHCCTSAFYYVVFWNILVVAFFLPRKFYLFEKTSETSVVVLLCLFFLPPGNNEQHFDGKVCSIY